MTLDCALCKATKSFNHLHSCDTGCRYLNVSRPDVRYISLLLNLFANGTLLTVWFDSKLYKTTSLMSSNRIILTSCFVERVMTQAVGPNRLRKAPPYILFSTDIVNKQHHSITTTTPRDLNKYYPRVALPLPALSTHRALAGTYLAQPSGSKGTSCVLSCAYREAPWNMAEVRENLTHICYCI